MNVLQEDPVTATRKRLEAMKVGERTSHSGDHSSQLAEAGTHQKKKLSDVKVDSSISATLAKNFANFAPPAASTKAAPTMSSGPDLLAFDDPAPAPKAAAVQPTDDWASFESAPAPKPAAAKAADPFSVVASAGDGWSSFSGPSNSPFPTSVVLFL